MKAILSTLLLAIGIACSAQGQIVYSTDYVIQQIGSDPTQTNSWANGFRSFSVREGESLSITLNGVTEGTYLLRRVTINGRTTDWPAYLGDVPGPAEVVFGWNHYVDRNGTVEVGGSPGAILAVVHVRTIATVFPPDKTVVIPAGSKGGALELQMSSDLVTWTPTVPGTYTSPTNHLFFRLNIKATP